MLPFADASATYLELGWFYYVFAAVVDRRRSGNAVNLTDGLDGLATMPVIIAGGHVHAIIAYLTGRIDYVRPVILASRMCPGRANWRYYAPRIMGAGLAIPVVQRAARRGVHGRYRQPGAGRRAGGHRGGRAFTRSSLRIVGGLFVLEALSVIIQVFFYKRTGRRVFKMAPIHHHFEQLGWSEPTVVIRFWIVSFVLALAGLATLKLR